MVGSMFVLEVGSLPVRVEERPCEGLVAEHLA
jgi:hypothetical protein